eukprot:2871187-Pleurochrysis_carterae.AAC.1
MAPSLSRTWWRLRLRERKAKTFFLFAAPSLASRDTLSNVCTISINLSANDLRDAGVAHTTAPSCLAMRTLSSSEPASSVARSNRGRDDLDDELLSVGEEEGEERQQRRRLAGTHDHLRDERALRRGGGDEGAHERHLLLAKEDRARKLERDEARVVDEGLRGGERGVGGFERVCKEFEGVRRLRRSVRPRSRAGGRGDGDCSTTRPSL